MGIVRLVNPPPITGSVGAPMTSGNTGLSMGTFAEGEIISTPLGLGFSPSDAIVFQNFDPVLGQDIVEYKFSRLVYPTFASPGYSAGVMRFNSSADILMGSSPTTTSLSQTIYFGSDSDSINTDEGFFSLNNYAVLDFKFPRSQVLPTNQWYRIDYYLKLHYITGLGSYPYVPGHRLVIFGPGDLTSENVDDAVYDSMIDSVWSTDSVSLSNPPFEVVDHDPYVSLMPTSWRMSSYSLNNISSGFSEVGVEPPRFSNISVDNIIYPEAFIVAESEAPSFNGIMPPATGSVSVYRTRDITLDASTSLAHYATIDEYLWKIETDGEDDVEYSTPDLIFNYDVNHPISGSAQYHRVHLHVRDSSGLWSYDAPYLSPGIGQVGRSKYSVIRVLNNPPAATAWSPTPTVSLGLATSFYSSGTDLDGTVVDYNWEIDGSSTLINGQNISRILALGTHTARVRATDNNGAVGWSSLITVDVTPATRPPLPQGSGGGGAGWSIGTTFLEHSRNGLFDKYSAI